MEYFFPVASVISFIVLFLLIRKDKNEDGSLTKKGWKKFWAALIVLFLASIAFLFISDFVVD
ncbi:DUF3976 domain-containing protein [Lentibacillus juripiscarius]|uniref:DUF3976 domain-containing protein n=1 Tax=Lentibacillus juripiscarius TaxID=257446 RepID=A0ABW5V5T5_9BACI